MCAKILEGWNKLSEIPKRVIKLAASNELPVTLRIGKEGLGENIVSELNSQLDSNKIVKIKLNKNIYDRTTKNECWSKLANLTNSKIVMKKGNVAVFYKL